MKTIAAFRYFNDFVNSFPAFGYCYDQDLFNQIITKYRAIPWQFKELSFGGGLYLRRSSSKTLPFVLVLK